MGLTESSTFAVTNTFQYMLLRKGRDTSGEEEEMELLGVSEVWQQI